MTVTDRSDHMEINFSEFLAYFVLFSVYTTLPSDICAKFVHGWSLQELLPDSLVHLCKQVGQRLSLNGTLMIFILSMLIH